VRLSGKRVVARVRVEPRVRELIQSKPRATHSCAAGGANLLSLSAAVNARLPESGADSLHD
jgi:hypothetical protein